MLSGLRIQSGLVVLLLAVYCPRALGQSSQAPQALAPEDVVAKASPSVVLILVGQGGERPSGLGSGLIVRSDGVILTAYHLVKGAQQVQVRLKSGEIFDQVELLGFDRRRDIAALRISGHGLPTLPIAKADAAKAGGNVYVVSHAGALSWTATAGILSATRLSDEVPGAGSGYRVLQFTAAVSPGSSGGALVDGQGNALGLVIGSTEGQNLNFAVPIESVLGLSETAHGTPYASGSELKLAEHEKAPAPAEASQAPPTPAAAATPKSTNSAEIVRRARTIYIQEKEGGAVSGFPAGPVEKKLLENKDFQAMGFVLTKDKYNADLLIELDRPSFSWDCTYRMTHQQSRAILGAGKNIAWDCIRAAPAISDQIVNRLKQLRAPTPQPLQPNKKP